MGEAVTVLIVDDEPSVRGLARSVLQRAGFRILEAGDGIQGLKVLREFGDVIALLLTDVKMPRLDGVSLAASAKDLFPKLPVVFMSGYIDPPHEKPPKGCVFLNKPFSPRILLEA